MQVNCFLKVLPDLLAPQPGQETIQGSEMKRREECQFFTASLTRISTLQVQR